MDTGSRFIIAVVAAIMAACSIHAGLYLRSQGWHVLGWSVLGIMLCAFVVSLLLMIRE